MRKPICNLIFLIVFWGTFTSATVAFAQSYPEKPIRILTGGAGGGSDFTARLIAQGISVTLGQPVIVDNRPSGLIATELAARALPDGYSLLFYGSNLWITPLMEKTSYDPLKDFLPISLTNREPYILVVHPSLPVKSVKELIQLAKTKPGVLNYASASIGSSTYLAAELFKSVADVNIVSIPYKSASPARNDLIAGRVHVMFATPAGIIPFIRSGKVRPLATTGVQRFDLLPNVPTVAATGLPTYEAEQLSGAFVPTKTSTAIINRLNQDIVQFLSKPETRKQFLEAGLGIVTSTPEQFTTVIKAEMARFGKLIKSAGIQAN